MAKGMRQLAMENVQGVQILYIKLQIIKATYTKSALT